MNFAETKPKEWELGKPCAGKPPARFDEGVGHVGGLPSRGSLYSTYIDFALSNYREPEHQKPLADAISDYTQAKAHEFE